MTDSWNYFTELDDEPFNNSISLLPSSLRDEFGEFSPPLDDQNISFSNFPDVPGHYFSESAPSSPFLYFSNGSPLKQFDFEYNAQNSLYPNNYCSIQFHQSRVSTFAIPPNLDLHVGDYVITEADRGLDIGLVISLTKTPPSREMKNSKKIQRKALQMKVNYIPIKLENERKALEICQKKVEELCLPMSITGAEYQFDGKKLTFYYTATKYVDFRNLVKILFHVFSTRIWMVWHDGTAPVKDVFTRNETPTLL